MRKNKSIKLPLILLELDEGNFHILIESKIGDSDTSHWVIDTGASKTVFDSSLQDKYIICDDLLSEIESAGIGNSKIETKVGIIERLYLGDKIIDNFSVGLIDLSNLNILYRQYTNYKIAGLIGSDFLLKYKANIDYESLTLSISI